MSKKVYIETAKKWAINAGVPTVSILGLYLMYSVFIGAITIDSFSDNQVCAGTEEDPCFAYVTFTVHEDVFWYPINYDPWGRDSPFAFDPNVKEWRLERSWGKGWRELPMDKGCTGTWCGGKKTNTKENPATYSVAWRAGNTYNIRIRALKNSPFDTIKWYSDGLGVPDPLWQGVELNIVYPCLENQTVQNGTICTTYNTSWVTPCDNYESECDANCTDGLYKYDSYQHCEYDWICNGTYYPNGSCILEWVEVCETRYTYYDCVRATNQTCLSGEYCKYTNVNYRFWEECEPTYITNCSKYDYTDQKLYSPSTGVTCDTSDMWVWCQDINNYLICDECGDGNCDGILEPGIKKVGDVWVTDNDINIESGMLREGLERLQYEGYNAALINERFKECGLI